ncbi:hypothetical protein HanPSC8_Chr03g0126031 [Helianthus annuus]|nr:hypothetical protein HanPSC8_Chr03g0126031 [Helianthus annuus]
MDGTNVLTKVRYCMHCQAHVKGFDHRGSRKLYSAGENIHLLFMILLARFITRHIMGSSKSKLHMFFLNLHFHLWKIILLKKVKSLSKLTTIEQYNFCNQFSQTNYL